MSAQLSPKPFVDGLDHPEGVTWGPDAHVYAGGEAGQVYRVSLDGTCEQFATTGGFLLGLCLDADLNVYACDTAHGAVMRITPAGEVSTYATAPGGARIVNPNWPVFGADGTLYVSDSGAWEAGDGSLYAVAPGGGEAVLLRDDVCGFPNGMALSADGARLFCAETVTQRVVAVAVEGMTSSGPVDEVARTPERTLPDGVALDAEGGVLIACYTPDVVYRATPGGGLDVLAEDWQRLALAAPTNVAFCGADLRTLVFASLGRWHLSRAEAAVPGMPLNYPRIR